jgi:hypothetical protein
LPPMESYQAFLFRKRETGNAYTNADFPKTNVKACACATGSHLLSSDEKGLQAWSLASIGKSGGTYVQCPICLNPHPQGNRKGLLDYERATSCFHWLCALCWETLRQYPSESQKCPLCRVSLSRALATTPRGTVRDLLLDGETACARCRVTADGRAVSVFDFLAWLLQGVEGVEPLWAHMETSRTDICRAVRYAILDPARFPLIVTAVVDAEDAVHLCAQYVSLACADPSARARARRLMLSRWHVFVVPLGFFVDTSAVLPDA